MADIQRTLKSGERITVRVKATGKYKSLPLVEVGPGDRVIVSQAGTSDPEPTEPEPAPTPGAFLSYPSSAAVRITSGSDVLIEGKSFVELGAGVAGILLENVRNALIRNCDFADVAEGIYALNCENVVIEDCRYRNILGPAQPRTGANVANFVQFNKVNGGAIRRCMGKGGDTEDIISLYQCNGTAASPLLVEDNWFEGTNWTSGSGSGIALGDGGSSYQIARRNRLLNPGQVGIFIAGGQNSQITDNIIMGEQRPESNVGAYVWNQSAATCSGHTVSGNQVNWRREDGVNNPFWNGNNCGPVVQEANDWNAALDINSLRVPL